MVFVRPAEVGNIIRLKSTSNKLAIVTKELEHDFLKIYIFEDQEFIVIKSKWTYRDSLGEKIFITYEKV